MPDVNTASLRALEAVRAKQGGNTLDAIVAVSREVAALRQPNLAMQDIKPRAASLREAATKLAAPRAWPDLPEDFPESKKILDRAVRDLSNIKKPKDVAKVAKIVEPIVDLLDYLLGETLIALAYAPVVGEASTLLGPAADMSHRHDFGLTSKPGVVVVVKRAAWKRPTFSSAEVPGRACGARRSVSTSRSRRNSCDASSSIDCRRRASTPATWQHSPRPWRSPIRASSRQRI